MGVGSWRLRLVVHPLTIASVALLAVNDHVLKQRWPGLITGKLSDLAGVWVVGALIIAVMSSVRWGSAMTALGFAALKTSPAVAVLAAPILGGVTRRDPTDLVALMVLWPLGRVATSVGARRSAHVNDAWSTVGGVFVVVAAMLTTSATSCDTAADVGDVVLSEDGDVLARYGDHGASYGAEWYVLTPDGARAVTDASPVGVVARKVCIDDVCFRAVPDEGVYENDRLVFEYSPAQSEHLDDLPCIQSTPFGSIVAVQSRNGIDVWVSAGVGGVLHRDTEGEWHEVAVGRARPFAGSDGGDGSGDEIILWLLPVLIGICAAVMLLSTNSRLATQQRTVLAAAASSVNLAWAFFSDSAITPPTDPGTFELITDLIHYGVRWGAPLALLQLIWIVPLIRWRRAANTPSSTTEMG